MDSVRLKGVCCAALVGIAAACVGASGDERSSAQACAVETSGIPLPDELRETSGIARTAAGDLWTHNDGAEAVLYRVTEGGDVVQRVSIEGAAAADAEDIDVGPCGSGGECLYLADIGDNDAERSDVRILIVTIPTTDAARGTAQVLTVRYPGGASDAEALAVLPDGEVLVATKGRDAPIALYRVPAAAAGGADVALERIALLASRPDHDADRVTAAAASEDGHWVAIRTHAALRIHASPSLLAGDPRPALEYDLRPLGERQGEGVEITSDGRVWLTSEAEGDGSPTLARLRCSLPD